MPRKYPPVGWEKEELERRIKEREKLEAEELARLRAFNLKHFGRAKPACCPDDSDSGAIKKEHENA